MTLYTKMKSSTQTNTSGLTYKDIMTGGFEKFNTTIKTIPVVLTSVMIDRFDKFIFEKYNDYYDDIVLAYNKLDRKDLEPGMTIQLISPSDIYRYYGRNL